jgi:myo-inositol 2-dehydrogenase/D-chiro-inositol 1-dehydrogenase
MERYAVSFANELQAFVTAVANGSPAPVSGIDGRMAVVMGLAARKSHDEHRAVRLEEIG